MLDVQNLPIAIIGAGPIGLAAAAHLVERGMKVKVYEAGASVGANVRDWAHVRIFTTWEQSVDTASVRLLEKHGWKLPQANKLPTGGEIYDQYLKPLAAVPELAGAVATNAKVLSISRLGLDKVTSKGRDKRPFEIRVVGPGGEVRVEYAQGVIDASGTWQNQNPAGASGTTAPGEDRHADRIAYGMPDVLGAVRNDYAGKRIAVIGAGYSAINVILDLTKLAEAAPGTKVTWVVRGTNMNKIYGGGANDQLEARGALGTALKRLVDQGKVQLITGFSTSAIRGQGNDLELVGTQNGKEIALPIADRIIVCTGQRPNLEITRELRLELDPWLEGVKALGPLIDPNEHSCGSVPPHGHRELSHPEPGFYTVGVKSYGRAPTFLLLTGYEQARSVAAVLAGDLQAADNVQLVLPETGICTTDFETDANGCCVTPIQVAASSCCGGPAPAEVDACCVADVVAKDAGKKGCGCGEAA
jgi:thioredoxin reductase